ncbi:MAG: hypothetical protein PHO02_05125 [Candidatus Nanoarchaeia archaeon]|nr:hypothetical protein [Candidatus Nanoarchaeia archaeon]
MKKAVLGIAALVSGCYLNVHTNYRLHDWTELSEGGSAIFHSGDASIHLNYYGPASNHADGAHDDIVFIGRHVPFEGYDERELVIGDGDVRSLFGYRFRFDILNDNDNVIENNRVVVYWDKE